MDCDPTFAEACSSTEPHLLTQGDLNDIDRDLNLSKKQAKLSGSRLKRWNLLHLETNVCFPRGCHEEFKNFFSQKDGVVFFNYVCSVVEVLGHEYNAELWRLSINSSKVSLKCVTWSLKLREEQRLRVFENRVLRRIFGSKRGEVKG
jgi:hypothetical protein